ncbi:MAG TPA: flagellar basal body rod protein FlgB [Rhizomicrobium sp.]|jgi:flagellar basal-body rod protein FlgB|nr:flagellar basal body rod protein FlgB [Terriglobales bacterium]HWU54913.1 flagellar basal body rod protein FlgB [Rhizomicrobium sp.]
MDMQNLPLLSLLRERMTWLNQRQDVLSQNVANADTPRYVARDLKPLDFDRMVGASAGTKMMTTNARHIAISSLRGGKFEDHETPDQESDPNGNAVSLEVEMIKVADTQAQYQAAANLYAKAVTMMKTAIGH